MSREIRDRAEFETGSKWFSDMHRSWDDDMTMIDLDGLGYCRRCTAFLYVVEATRSNGRKTAFVAEALAKELRVPLLVVYKVKSRPDDVLVDDRLHRFSERPFWVVDAELRLVFRRIRDAHTCRTGGV